MREMKCVIIDGVEYVPKKEAKKREFFPREDISYIDAVKLIKAADNGYVGKFEVVDNDVVFNLRICPDDEDYEHLAKGQVWLKKK